MAELTSPQVQEILAQGQNNEVRVCVKQEQHLVFHVEPSETKWDKKYTNNFLKWIKIIIDDQKYEVFKHLLQSPFETVDFTEGLFNELKKIFDARDSFINHTFQNPDLEKDFDQYLASIGDIKFWKNQGFDAFRNAICSVLIVDLEVTQEGDAPEPYYYLLPVENVIQYVYDDNDNFEFIIFERDKTFFAFDSVWYRSYVKNQGGEFVLVSEVAHDLGYVPAKSFWKERYNKTSELNRRSVLTNALGRLDWLLSLNVFKKHESLYAGFPIDVMYEQKCTYIDDQQNPCEAGWIHSTVKEGTKDEYTANKVPCPECNGGSNKNLGAGSILIAPPMEHKDDPDMIKGMNRISADVESLGWVQGEIEKQEKFITWRVIGVSPDQAKEAMNEIQVAGNFESRENVLFQVKNNFELIQTFAINTVGRLRYGQDAYLGSVVNYGKDFFFKSLGFISEQLSASRANGMPIFEIINTNNQFIKSKYRDNPEMLERQEILSFLEPYQGYSIDELMTMQGIDLLKMTIKLNLYEYVQRFELEFMNIVNFMAFVDFDEKILFIQTKIDEYGKEDNESRIDAGGNEPAESGSATQ